MTANGWLQIAIFFLLILVCAKPLGSFIATVIEGRRNFLSPVFGPVERLIYRLCGVLTRRNRGTALDPLRRRAARLQPLQRRAALRLPAAAEMAAVQSAGLQPGQRQPRPRLQHRRQLHHQHQLASYTPETTLSYFVQMAGLTVHNFISAAAGLAIAIAWCAASRASRSKPSATSGST